MFVVAENYAAALCVVGEHPVVRSCKRQAADIAELAPARVLSAVAVRRHNAQLPRKQLSVQVEAELLTRQSVRRAEHHSPPKAFLAEYHAHVRLAVVRRLYPAARNVYHSALRAALHLSVLRVEPAVRVAHKHKAQPLEQQPVAHGRLAAVQHKVLAPAKALLLRKSAKVVGERANARHILAAAANKPCAQPHRLFESLRGKRRGRSRLKPYLSRKGQPERAVVRDLARRKAALGAVFPRNVPRRARPAVCGGVSRHGAAVRNLERQREAA